MDFITGLFNRYFDDLHRLTNRDAEPRRSGGHASSRTLSNAYFVAVEIAAKKAVRKRRIRSRIAAESRRRNRGK